MGFPCQDISTAGFQKGFEGKRSSLFVVGIKVCIKMKVRSQIVLGHFSEVHRTSVFNQFDFVCLLGKIHLLGERGGPFGPKYARNIFGCVGNSSQSKLCA